MRATLRKFIAHVKKKSKKLGGTCILKWKESPPMKYSASPPKKKEHKSEQDSLDVTTNIYKGQRKMLNDTMGIQSVTSLLWKILQEK